MSSDWEEDTGPYCTGGHYNSPELCVECALSLAMKNVAWINEDALRDLASAIRGEAKRRKQKSSKGRCKA